MKTVKEEKVISSRHFGRDITSRLYGNGKAAALKK